MELEGGAAPPPGADGARRGKYDEGERLNLFDGVPLAEGLKFGSNSHQKHGKLLRRASRALGHRDECLHIVV